MSNNSNKGYTYSYRDNLNDVVGSEDESTRTEPTDDNNVNDDEDVLQFTNYDDSVAGIIPRRETHPSGSRRATASGAAAATTTRTRTPDASLQHHQRHQQQEQQQQEKSSSVYKRSSPLSPFSPLLQQQQQLYKRNRPSSLQWDSGAATATATTLKNSNNVQVSLAPCRRVSVVVLVSDPVVDAVHYNNNNNSNRKQNSTSNTTAGVLKYKSLSFQKSQENKSEQQHVAAEDERNQNYCLFPLQETTTTTTTTRATATKDDNNKDKNITTQIISSRDLIVVNPFALSQQTNFTMETARMVAELAHISSEDWIRIYRFHHVVWPARLLSSQQAEIISQQQPITTATTTTTTTAASPSQQHSNTATMSVDETLLHTCRAAVNDVMAVGSISSRTLLALGCHPTKTFTLFGQLAQQSLARVLSQDTQTLTQNDILYHYGLLGWTVQQILQQLPSHAACTLTVLEINEYDACLYDLLSKRPFRRDNAVTLRYSGTTHGPILHGASNAPIDSLRTVGHLLRRAMAAAHHVRKQTPCGTIVATVKVWHQQQLQQPLPRPTVSQQPVKGMSDQQNHPLLPNHKYTSIQFVDVQHEYQHHHHHHDDYGGTSHSNNMTSSTNNDRRQAAVRKAVWALGGVLRGTLLKEAGNEATISYRDSMLTKVLQRSMDTPDSRTVVLAAVSPVDYEESMATLRYVSRLIHRPGQTPQSPFDSGAVVIPSSTTSPRSMATMTANSATSPMLPSGNVAATTDQSMFVKQLVSDPRQRLAKVYRPDRATALDSSMETNEEELQDYIPTQYEEPQSFEQEQQQEQQERSRGSSAQNQPRPRIDRPSQWQSQRYMQPTMADKASPTGDSARSDDATMMMFADLSPRDSSANISSKAVLASPQVANEEPQLFGDIDKSGHAVLPSPILAAAADTPLHQNKTPFKTPKMTTSRTTADQCKLVEDRHPVLTIAESTSPLTTETMTRDDPYWNHQQPTNTQQQAHHWEHHHDQYPSHHHSLYQSQLEDEKCGTREQRPRGKQQQEQGNLDHLQGNAEYLDTSYTLDRMATQIVKNHRQQQQEHLMQQSQQHHQQQQQQTEVLDQRDESLFSSNYDAGATLLQTPTVHDHYIHSTQVASSTAEMDDLSLELQRKTQQGQPFISREQQAMDDLSMELLRQQANLDSPNVESSSQDKAKRAEQPADTLPDRGLQPSQLHYSDQEGNKIDDLSSVASRESFHKTRRVFVDMAARQREDAEPRSLGNDKLESKHRSQEGGTEDATSATRTTSVLDDDDSSLRRQIEEAKRSSKVDGVSQDIAILKVVVDHIKTSHGYVSESSLSAIESLRNFWESQKAMVASLTQEREDYMKAIDQLQEEFHEQSQRTQQELHEKTEMIMSLEEKIRKTEDDRTEAVKIAEQAIGLQEELENRVNELEQAQSVQARESVPAKEYSALQQAKESLEEELLDLQHEVNIYKKEIGTSDQKISTLEYELENAERRKALLTAENDRFQSEIDLLNDRLQRSHRSEAELAAYEKELTRLRNEIQTNLSASQTQESKLNAQLNEKTEAIELLQRDIDNLKAELSQAEGERQREDDAKRKEISRLHELLAQARTESSNAASELDNLSARLDSTLKEKHFIAEQLEKTRQELEQRLSDVHELSSSLKKVLQEKQDAERREGYMEEALQAFQNETRTKVQKMVHDQQDAKVLLQSTLEENAALAQTIQELQATLESVRRERDDRGSHWQENRYTLQALERENKKLRESNQALKAKLERTMQDIRHSALVSDESNVGGLNEHERDNAELRESNRALKAEIERIRNSGGHHLHTRSYGDQAYQGRQHRADMGVNLPTRNKLDGEAVQPSLLLGQSRAEEIAAYMAVSAKAFVDRGNSEALRLKQQMYALEDAKDAEIEALRSRIRTLERRFDLNSSLDYGNPGV